MDAMNDSQHGKRAAFLNIDMFSYVEVPLDLYCERSHLVKQRGWVGWQNVGGGVFLAVQKCFPVAFVWSLWITMSRIVPFLVMMCGYGGRKGPPVVYKSFIIFRLGGCNRNAAELHSGHLRDQTRLDALGMAYAVMGTASCGAHR